MHDRYRHLGAAVRLSGERSAEIVREAMPHAVSVLERPVGSVLPVVSRVVEPELARGGSLIPAWPMIQPDGSVVIEFVEDWGALLAIWIETVDGAQRSLAEDLVRSGHRLWIGIGNDVLQLFVNDPPAGTYSMVRHHALMLAAATAWLGPDSVQDWCRAHISAGAAFLNRHVDEPLWAAIDAAERGLDSLLGDPRTRLPAPAVVAWLDGDVEARARYVDYLGAASLGVAAVLEAMPQAHVTSWLTHAVSVLHADPEFNRTWIEQTVHRLAAVAAH